jgi:hypothetical protein
VPKTVAPIVMKRRATLPISLTRVGLLACRFMLWPFYAGTNVQYPAYPRLLQGLRIEGRSCSRPCSLQVERRPAAIDDAVRRNAGITCFALLMLTMIVYLGHQSYKSKLAEWKWKQKMEADQAKWEAAREHSRKRA